VKLTSGGRLVAELSTSSFAGAGPQAHFGALVSAAQGLQAAARRNPQQPPGPDTVPNLDRLQRAVTDAQGVLVQDILAHACRVLTAGCFAAGTLLLTEHGWRPVELIEPGERVWSRPEGDRAGEAGWREVEGRLVRTGRVLHLHAGGLVVRTTPEHPFWVDGTGWVEAGGLVPGERIATLSGSWAEVEEVYDTGKYERVYNLQVADYHTYFVGGPGVDALWAHNACVNFVMVELGDADGMAWAQAGWDYRQAQIPRARTREEREEWRNGGKTIAAVRVTVTPPPTRWYASRGDNHAEEWLIEGLTGAGIPGTRGSVTQGFSERHPCDNTGHNHNCQGQVRIWLQPQPGDCITWYYLIEHVPNQSGSVLLARYNYLLNGGPWPPP
jgi:hypothetical protein